ncbi:MAG: hypothetical protein ACRYGF_04735 [Janthinobacterium lividum]
MQKLTGATCFLLFWGSACAQTGSSVAIPPTAPTQSVSNLPSARPVVPATHSGQGQVTWTGSVLSVKGNGDSLRNLLRQVARTTGMRVTGGIPDEQVFGSYGPAPVQQVLADLFNGLNVNLLLVNGSQTQPKELILTTRSGGPTPPSATQPMAMEDPADVNLAQPRPGRHTSPDSFSGLPAQTQQGSQQAGPAVPLNDTSATGNGSAADTSAAATGQPQSSDGVKTPEQIFEELRNRQQQNTNHR